MALISKARSRVLAFAAVATTTLAPGFAAPAAASPIEYTETATGSGTLNGTAFTNDLITNRLRRHHRSNYRYAGTWGFFR